MKCSKCGNELLDNAKFCMGCGAAVSNGQAPAATLGNAADVPVTEMALTCPKCSAAMPAGAKMCGICGSALAEPEPVTTRLPAEPAPHFQPVDRAVLSQYTIPDSGAPAAVAAAKPRAASTKRNIIILVAALAVLVVGAVFALFAFGSGQRGEAAEVLELAQRYLSEENYDQAVIEFERLIEIDPKNTDAYLGLAEAYKALGDHDKAAKALERALAEVSEDDKRLIEEAIGELGRDTKETTESTTAVTAIATVTTTTDMNKVTHEADNIENITEESSVEIIEPTEESYQPISFGEAVSIYGYSEIIENCNGMGQDGYVYDFIWENDRAITAGSVFDGCHVYEARTVLLDNNIDDIWSVSFRTDNEISLECDIEYWDGPDGGYYILSDSIEIELPFLGETASDICLNETKPYEDDMLQRYGKFPCSITIRDYGAIFTQHFGGYFADIVDIEFLSEPNITDMPSPDPIEVELMLYNIIHNNNHLSVIDKQMLSGVTSLVISGGGNNEILNIYVECGNKTGTKYNGHGWTSARYSDSYRTWEPYHIDDLSFLSYLTKIESLSIICCDVSDISVISELTTLKEIDLTNNSVIDLAPLEKLINLESLILYGNGGIPSKYTNISVLGKLKNLRLLDLCSGGYDDLSFLSELTQMEYLYLDGGLSDDISELEGMNHLKGLTISGRNITDISLLANAVELEELCIRVTSVSDISSLTNLKNLKLLSLMYNSVTDVMPIKELVQLETLYLCEPLSPMEDWDVVKESLPNLIR